MINPSSYTMDYEKEKIILSVYGESGITQTEISEKDVKSMKEWFDMLQAKKKS